METREESEKLKRLAEEAIGEFPFLEHLRGNPCKIKYLVSNGAPTAKGNTVLGKCIKVPSKDRWAIDAHYLIVIYEPNTKLLAFDDRRMKILLSHELLHITMGLDGKGNMKYDLRGHDYEEFAAIKDSFGLDWADPQLQLFPEEKPA